MNNRQVISTIIGICALILIVLELVHPARIAFKVAGIIPMALVFISMLLLFLAEEKKKRNSKEK